MGIILIQLFINFIFFSFYDPGSWRWYRIAAIFAYPAMAVQLLFLRYLSINIYTHAPTETSFEWQMFLADSIIFGAVSVTIQLFIIFQADKILQVIKKLNNKLDIDFI